ncbi:MAG TPA: PAS domain S-box protein [Candidatus Paceibacterota bacterium]|nr:PAS domain S-box protein [Verrucomicrobiota bacterium]HRY52033.1 PAS domain S-box protein [Candidatus Paceibacterota bacterium]
MISPPASMPQSPAAAMPASRNHWWRCLFEQSEDGQLVCRDDGRVYEANSRATQLLGAPAHAAEGGENRLTSRFTATTARKLRELLDRQTGRQETLSAVPVLSEGRIVLMADLQVTPLGEGFSLVTVKDASRRWRMESHVQRLVTAVDSTPDVIFITDAEFRLAFVNAAFQTVTGHTIEEALGNSTHFLRASSEQSRIDESLARVAAGHDWRGELINCRRDGSLYMVESSISPIFDHKGAFLGCVAFERDITQNRRLQDELRIERNYALSIINSLDSAVYTIDHQFCLSHINDGWKKMPPRHGWLYLQEPPCAGRSLLDYVEDPERQLELQMIFQSVLANGQSQEIQATGDQGDHWLIKIAPWLHEGEIRGLLYGVTNQTRFHELQCQLYQAQKMEVIGALAAGVAHDFNNLLQAIRGNIGLLLLESQEDRENFHNLQQADQAAARAAEITQQLLSFSRVSDEEDTILDFNQVIQEAGLLFKRSLMSKVELVLQPETQPLAVRVDGTRAQQLLLNLCVNAQDAMMPQGGRITITNRSVILTPEQKRRCARVDTDQFLHCTVADTGCGIKTELIQHIFDPFFTTKGKGKGTGLGLAIVRSIIDQAGGFVDVESHPGTGTAFHIYLPLSKGEITAKPKVSRARLSRGSGRILVVDDLDLVLDFTRTFLRAVGYDVTVATSAEDALEILDRSKSPVQLLFTDYNMTGMNGWQLIQKARSQWPQMKFVLTTGYIDDLVRHEIQHDPTIRVLEKPFQMRDAADLIADLLQSSSPSPPDESQIP